jgi:hypothetical protein
MIRVLLGLMTSDGVLEVLDRRRHREREVARLSGELERQGEGGIFMARERGGVQRAIGGGRGTR